MSAISELAEATGEYLRLLKEPPRRSPRQLRDAVDRLNEAHEAYERTPGG